VATTMETEIPVPKSGNEIIKLEGDFYKPINTGRNPFGEKHLCMEFQNSGRGLYVVIGRKARFEAIPLMSGEKKNIEIKINGRGEYEFGVVYTPITNHKLGDREFPAKMYDGHQVTCGKSSKFSEMEELLL